MFVRQKIVLVQDRNLSALPPLITVVDVLSRVHDVTVFTSWKNSPEVEKMKERGVKFYFYREDKFDAGNRGLFSAIKVLYLKFREALWFRKQIREKVKNKECDLCWVGSSETAFLLKGLLPSQTYVVCAYELMENSPWSRFFLRNFYRSAKAVVVPEYNRAYILQVLMRLASRPCVIPNKPEFDFLLQEGSSGRPSKKTILYQGIFDPQERKLDAFCEAVDSLYPEYELLLLGNKTGYVDFLCEKYKGTRFGGYFPAPAHLKKTKEAYIGIATYKPTSLNSIYCAPNKIWEYGGCGVPMLINDIPGLTSALSSWNCSVVVDENDPCSIVEGIKKISESHSEYVKNARAFYESVDVSKEVLCVVEGGESLKFVMRGDSLHAAIGVFARFITVRLYRAL